MTNTATNTLPVWFVVAAWATLSVVLNVLGVLANQPDRPPIALLVSVIGPPILFVIAYSLSARVRSLSLGLDLRFPKHLASATVRKPAQTCSKKSPAKKEHQRERL
jgi:hypothetical protein